MPALKKVAFITGAASGIGRASALAFARDGADVVVADCQVDGGLETVRMIEQAGGRALFIKCDVSYENDIREAVAQTVKKFGRLDYAFNNAGVEGESGLTPECSVENWDRVIRVNLTGVWLCMKYQVPQMLAQGSGSIVNCSSIAGLVGFQGIPAYVASKHAVVGLTKATALEYARSNIRVNAICPGVIDTPMITRFTHGEAQAARMLLNNEPVGRMGTSEEIAEAAVWLCSDKASFVTGHALVADGGWVAQ